MFKISPCCASEKTVYIISSEINGAGWQRLHLWALNVMGLVHFHPN